MKGIEEIENLQMEELERMAEDCSIAVPEDLALKVESALIATAGARKAIARAWKLTGIVSLAGAALAAVLFVGSPRQPKDTYSDPLLAYAEIERAFNYISQKTGSGLEVAQEAAPVIEKTINVIR